ncbi:unnamed protein product [Protopolystoma xenopodis]|uniref:PDZ domain-containing protein n=1 Tax=Protopolystoma xenopodis TaxID=117903 RepID=A0A3S5A6G3_9PLAT|nr:unnamed protein product [Protopolystoma xenopodis]
MSRSDSLVLLSYLRDKSRFIHIKLLQIPFNSYNYLVVCSFFIFPCSRFLYFIICLSDIKLIIPKQRGELLGVVIVESGWGSLLPTAVVANMQPAGPAARCGQLNIGNQIISVNGHSLVGLPLSSCQQLIKVGPTL